MKKYSGLYLIVVIFIAFALMLPGCGKKRPTHKADYDVIIIGGGIGGLSAGVHLALNGLTVLLLEQHDKVGGCTTSFARGPFTFDTALHVMAGGGPGKLDRGLYELLEITGVGKKVELYELPHFYRSIFPGGIDVRLPNNWEGFKEALKKRWPEESEGIDKFHRLCKDTFSELLTLTDLFRYGGFRALLTKMLVPVRQRTFFTWSDKTLQQLMDECFTSEEIKAVVSQLWVYYGAPVKDQTALLTLAATESLLADGLWHVKGTSQALSNAYAERLKELGGTVKTNTLVTKIIIEDGVAKGVETESGEKYTARYILANTDPYQLVFTLVGEDYFPADYVDKLKEMKPANSLFGVYLGLNIDLRKRGYTDTEIFYNTTLDSALLYERMMKGDFKNSIVLLTIYSNYGDPIYAPPGKSLVTLTAYSDYKYWPEDEAAYRKLKEEKMNELIKLASNVIPELADPKNIAVKEGYTPRTLKRYTMNRDGIVYGFYMSPDQVTKIPNHTPIDNIFIASNWTQAWHGVSAGQINGWQAARLILDVEGIE